MTDTQILTLAIAVIVPLSLLIYSHSRISDVSGILGKRIDDINTNLSRSINEAKDTLRAEMNTLRAEMVQLRTHIDAGFERMYQALMEHNKS